MLHTKSMSMYTYPSECCKHSIEPVSMHLLHTLFHNMHRYAPTSAPAAKQLGSTGWASLSPVLELSPFSSRFTCTHRKKHISNYTNCRKLDHVCYNRAHKHKHLLVEHSCPYSWRSTLLTAKKRSAVWQTYFRPLSSNKIFCMMKVETWGWMFWLREIFFNERILGPWRDPVSLERYSSMQINRPSWRDAHQTPLSEGTAVWFPCATGSWWRLDHRPAHVNTPRHPVKNRSLIFVTASNLMQLRDSTFTSAPMTPKLVKRSFWKGAVLVAVFKKGYKYKGICAA